MEHIVKDVARVQGKPIYTNLAGTDVEIDKTVLEKIKDPLMHLVRNAVDHGIESPADREKAGKNKVGQILIEGIQTASHVVIRVKDDGAGLRTKKIYQKALDQNLIDLSKGVTEKEIHEFILLPGFSTADVVTDISGRGIGMSVVKNTVQELNGKIDIKSTPDKGTEFFISFPSTLSILDAVIVIINDIYYAVPVQNVEEVVDITSENSEHTNPNSRILNLRGKIMPLERLDRFLKNDEEVKVLNSGGAALVTTYEGHKMAFEVTRIEGLQPIVVRKLEEKLADVPGFVGATILSNGEPSMIVDLSAVAKNYILTTAT
jgi:two-component system chemotaxis sensor kinase CheA